jgi:hypothetical protein
MVSEALSGHNENGFPNTYIEKVIKIILLLFTVHRVPECLSLRRNWVLPPLLRKRLCSVYLPLDPSGGKATCARMGEGVGGGANSDDWKKVWHSVSSVSVILSAGVFHIVRAHHSLIHIVSLSYMKRPPLKLKITNTT